MALIILCTTVLIGTASNGQMLRPARAVYDLQLNKDRTNATIVAATGRLVVELIEVPVTQTHHKGMLEAVAQTGRYDLMLPAPLSLPDWFWC